MDKIICIGKNYLDHAKELGDAIPARPVLFFKPPSVLLAAKELGETLHIELPTDRGSVHHECEIVVKIDQNLKIEAFTLGLDLTLREAQDAQKKNGHPWEIAKSFRNSAIIGTWLPLQDHQDYLQRNFSFTLNGQIKQSAEGKSMRLNPESCLAYAKEFFPICPGDLIFTGTPAGVGPLQKGDQSELIFDKQVLLRVLWS